MLLLVDVLIKQEGIKMKRVLVFKKFEHLQEELIPANSKSLKLLKQNMKDDPELNKRLTTPATNNLYYRYLAI
jgi:hypothetical protein